MIIYKVSDENGTLYCSSIARAAREIQTWVSNEERYADIDSSEELASAIRKGFKSETCIQYIEHDLTVESISVY